MDAVDVAVVAFAEDHSVERPVEDDPDPHHVLLALHLEVLDLGHVGGLGDLPGVSTVGSSGQSKSTVCKTKKYVSEDRDNFFEVEGFEP